MIQLQGRPAEIWARKLKEDGGDRERPTGCERGWEPLAFPFVVSVLVLLFLRGWVVSLALGCSNRCLVVSFF